MGQILVRNLDDGVIERLKKKAVDEKVSLEQFVRNLLFVASKPSKEEMLADMDRLRNANPYTSIDAVDLIRADRDSRSR